MADQKDKKATNDDLQNQQTNAAEAVSNPLLNYAAQVTSDELYIVFYNGEPRVRSRRELQRSDAEKFDILLSNGIIVPAHQLATEEGCRRFADVQKSMRNSISAVGLKLTILEETNKKYITTPDNSHADLIIRLANKYPQNTTFAEMRLQAESGQLTYVRRNEFYTKIAADPEFQGSAGVQKLNDYLRSVITQPEHRHYNIILWNTIVDTFQNVGIGHQEGVVDKIAPMSIVYNERSESIADFTVNSLALQEEVAKNFSADKARKARDYLKKIAEEKDFEPYQAALSDADAKAALDKTLGKINPSGMAGRLTQAAFSDPQFNAVVIPDVHVTAYQGSDAGGFADGFNNEMYVVSKGDAQQILKTTIEESLHIGFGRLYQYREGGVILGLKTYPNSHASDLSTPQSFVQDNSRQMLFNRALLTDMSKNGIEVMRKELGLPEEMYDFESFQAEVLVKIIKLREVGEWNSTLADHYRHLEHYIDTVLPNDIAAWEQAKQAGIEWKPAKLLPKVDFNHHLNLIFPEQVIRDVVLAEEGVEKQSKRISKIFEEQDFTKERIAKLVKAETSRRLILNTDIGNDVADRLLTMLPKT